MTMVTFGNERLAGELTRRLKGQPSAVATVSPRGTLLAAVKADDRADFEIGSVSKGLTGLLYAQALDRGEVTAGTTLGELLAVRDTPVADVTLGSLAIHRSGLPTLPSTDRPARRWLDVMRHGTNPYEGTVADLLDQVRTVRLGRNRPRYANLGFELLGHALASAAGTTFADLLHERLAGPLGLTGLYLPATPGDLRPTALPGRTRRGRPRPAWTGVALGPAGGVRATIADLARLAGALLDGSAPGVAALDPVAEMRGPYWRIGAAWFTFDHRGRTITWHNGGTPGFRAWLGIERATGTGVVVLVAAGVPVDRHGFELLEELSRSVSGAKPPR